MVGKGTDGPPLAPQAHWHRMRAGGGASVVTVTTGVEMGSGHDGVGVRDR